MSRYIPVITKEYSRKISVDDIIYLEKLPLFDKNGNPVA